LTFLARLFGDRRERQAMAPLYRAVVEAARDPAWYREGQVPDTLEGRFDMVAAVLALLLLRLEREGEAARRESVLLTELFIDDMDGTLRQIGIGDFVVGKHVGRLMAALGGRLGAFRDAFAGAAELEPAVRRNIFRDAPADEEGVTFVSGGLQALRERIEASPLEALLEGEIKGR
jgi:cytochrome b pre-mRNA-processing protein 3